MQAIVVTDKIFEAAGIKSFTKLTFDQADIVNEMKEKLLNEKIFLMIITSSDIYNITHENTKINYEFFHKYFR